MSIQKNENAGVLVPEVEEADPTLIVPDPPAMATAPKGPDHPPRSPVARAAAQRGIFLVTCAFDGAKPGAADFRSLHTDRDEAWQAWAERDARCTHEDFAYLIQLRPETGDWLVLEGP